MNVQEKVAAIKASVDELTKQAQEIIAEACVEWLNGLEAETAGVDKIVFGGGTPSFNDGEPCTFNLYDVWATNMNSDDISSPYQYDDIEEDGVVSLYGRATPKGFQSIDKMIQSLDSIGIIERAFNSYGFIAVVNKDGTIKEKDYDVGY